MATCCECGRRPADVCLRCFKMRDRGWTEWIRRHDRAMDEVLGSPDAGAALREQIHQLLHIEDDG